MKKSLTIFLFFALVSIHHLNAQQHNTVEIHSVNDAIEGVLNANPTILVYGLQKEKAEKNYKIAKAYRLPTITGSASGQRNISLATTPLPGEIFGQPGTVINAQLGQEYNYNAGIYLSKNIFDWQLHMNSKIAKFNIETANLETEAFKQKLTEQTALYYYSALITKEALRINKEDLKIADSIQTLANQKFKAGLIDKISLNQAAINYFSIQQTIAGSEQLLNNYLNQLHILLGFHKEETLFLTETLNNFSAKLIATPSLDESLDVQMASHRKEESLLNLKAQKAVYYPKLTLGAYFGKQQFRDNFGLTFSEGDWNNYRYVNLNISVPIFTGFTNKNKIKISKIDYEIASKNHEIEKENSAQNDNLLLKNYNTSLKGLQSSLENYQLNKENTELNLQKYNEGLIGLDIYLKSFEDYLNAQNNYLNTLSSTYTYYATILSRQ